MNYTTPHISIYLFLIKQLTKLVFICFESRTDLFLLAKIQTYNFISSAASQRHHGIFASTLRNTVLCLPYFLIIVLLAFVLAHYKTEWIRWTGQLKKTWHLTVKKDEQYGNKTSVHVKTLFMMRLSFLRIFECSGTNLNKFVALPWRITNFYFALIVFLKL